jgi:hypothetical protein
VKITVGSMRPPISNAEEIWQQLIAKQELNARKTAKRDNALGFIYTNNDAI